MSARLTTLCAAVALLLCYLPTFARALDDARLMEILVAAYPEFLAGHEGNELIWRDGTRMPFDDGRAGKTFTKLLDAPSIKDMFYTPYPLGHPGFPPGLDIDPGRVRNQAFFFKMYGDCRKGEVAQTMTNVVWLPKKWGKPVRVTRTNGVAEKLARISAELDQLPASFDKYLVPPAGTLNCRVIAGTERLSAHGSGTAIDIATRHAHYWQWSNRGSSSRYIWRNEVPVEIVEIFEKHEFIWGGKWYHYDTMHFEYRPELIAAAKQRQLARP